MKIFFYYVLYHISQVHPDNSTIKYKIKIIDIQNNKHILTQ